MGLPDDAVLRLGASLTDAEGKADKARCCGAARFPGSERRPGGSLCAQKKIMSFGGCLTRPVADLGRAALALSLPFDEVALFEVCRLGRVRPVVFHAGDARAEQRRVCGQGSGAAEHRSCRCRQHGCGGRH